MWISKRIAIFLIDAQTLSAFLGRKCLVLPGLSAPKIIPTGSPKLPREIRRISGTWSSEFSPSVGNSRGLKRILAYIAESGLFRKPRALVQQDIQWIARGVALLSVFYISCALCAEHRYPFSESDRDPFSPLVTRSGQILVQKNIGVKSFELKGIIYSESGSIAIIGKELYKKNDKIADYVIVKIGKKKVILKKGKELLILKLEE